MTGSFANSETWLVWPLTRYDSLKIKSNKFDWSFIASNCLLFLFRPFVHLVQKSRSVEQHTNTILTGGKGWPKFWDKIISGYWLARKEENLMQWWRILHVGDFQLNDWILYNTKRYIVAGTIGDLYTKRKQAVDMGKVGYRDTLNELRNANEFFTTSMIPNECQSHKENHSLWKVLKMASISETLFKQICPHGEGCIRGTVTSYKQLNKKFLSLFSASNDCWWNPT